MVCCFFFVVVSEVKNHNASLKEHKRTFLGIRCTCKERTGGLVCIQKFCKELKMIGYLHSSALPLMSVKGAGYLFSFKHMLLTPDFQVTDLETTSPISYLPLLICSPPLPCCQRGLTHLDYTCDNPVSCLVSLWIHVVGSICWRFKARR